MMKLISGKAFVYGNNIDTDQIYPGRYLDVVDPNEIAKHCMEGADASLVNKMSPGDIIVAGKNFGCGSSREHAAITLIHAEVGAVVAESFGRIFYRNAINLGLSVLVCPDITKKVNTGDILKVNFLEGYVQNKSNTNVIQGEKVSDYIMEIIQAGGIKQLFKKNNLK
ncbi:MAG: 3-isopropylmalate dehydratase small subunit [Peptostreptococcaceae bacterium]|nr:3-isopropylmalate dehydratase small subunit [Peptostreptococcaceae bacterium]